MMKNNRIAIVGAGIGGLATAYVLENTADDPLDITIFEDSHRVGGKIQTGRFDTIPLSYEVGAAELYDIEGSPALRKLVTELRLQCVCLKGSPIIVLGGTVLRNPRDVHDKLGPSAARAIQSFMSQGKSLRSPISFGCAGFPADNEHPWSKRTFADLLSSIPDTKAQRYLKIQAHSDLATEPPRTNAVYGFDNLLIDDPQYCRLYSIAEGNERLPKELRRKLVSRVYLDTHVRGIAQMKGKGYIVDAIRQSVHRRDEYDVVILALSHQQLSRIRWRDNDVKYIMRTFLTHYDYPAHYLRVTVAFKSPFWRDQFDESYFILDSFGGCCVYDESARNSSDGYGCLSWLIAGRNAFSMHLLPDIVVINRALASLPGSLASIARDAFLEAHVHRWIGSVCGQPSGLPIKGLAERHQPDASELPGLFVVGDYLLDSTINGVLESAGIVSHLALQFLEIQEHPTSHDNLAASAQWSYARS
jgi:phytoene dehydrogenase-like protein